VTTDRPRIEPCSGDSRGASWTGHVSERLADGTVVTYDRLNVRTELVRPGDWFAPPGFQGWRVPVASVRHLDDGATILAYNIESYGRIRRHEVTRKSRGFTTVYIRTPH